MITPLFFFLLNFFGHIIQAFLQSLLYFQRQHGDHLVCMQGPFFYQHQTHSDGPSSQLLAWVTSSAVKKCILLAGVHILIAHKQVFLLLLFPLSIVQTTQSTLKLEKFQVFMSPYHSITNFILLTGFIYFTPLNLHITLLDKLCFQKSKHFNIHMFNKTFKTEPCTLHSICISFKHIQ